MTDLINFTLSNSARNHFKGYSWEDLEFWGLDLPYSELGWTEQSWERIEEPPATSSLSWKELTQEKRKFASEVCYFRDNWDGLDMTPNNGPFPLPRVKKRYVEWTALPRDIRLAIKDSLHYNKTTWNTLGTADIEQKSWELLTDRQKSDAIDLGFYKRTWDCFQHHYRSYAWENLDTDSRDALQVLGWSEASWAANDEPPSYGNEWSRLSEAEQSIAAELCFFEDNWDGNSLAEVSETLTGEITNEQQAPPAQAPGEPPATDNQGQDAPSDASSPADQGSSANMIGAMGIMSGLSVVYVTVIPLLM